MERKIRVICPSIWSHHNTGWPCCVRELKAKLHTNIGVDFYSNSIISMLERGWRAERPWVGVVHATPEECEKKLLPENISMKKCLGLFALSEYACNHLRSVTGKKVSRINLAVGKPLRGFDPKAFLQGQPKIMTIGHWRRRFESIYELRAEGYRRVILKCSAPEAPDYLKMSEEASKFGVNIEEGMDSAEYEKALQNNIVFLHLEDSSANNTIIECIMSRTPLLVNRLPALEEHLGKDYPLFYDNIEEASNKIEDKSMVILSHKYLCGIDTRPYEMENFANTVSESEVYKCLPSIKL